MGNSNESGSKLPVLETATALAVAFIICKAGSFVTKYFGIQGGSMPAITAIVVILATALPKQFNQLAPSGEAMAMILMQVSNYQVNFHESLIGDISESCPILISLKLLSL